MYHLGDPCIHCGVSHDDVEPGICQKAIGLGANIRNIEYLKARLEQHEKSAALTSESLRKQISDQKTIVLRAGEGIDLTKVTLAETILYAGNHKNGGEDWNGARQDAIKWFATCARVGTNPYYGDLRTTYFGTKNYDRWHGQREDHEYGMGPRHGSICFEIGLRKEARTRDLTDAEREAAIYYLVNLERIQTTKVTV